MVQTVAERFWSKVDKSGDCWLWTAGIAMTGYGIFGPKHGQALGAHRVAWELTNGPIPAGLFVCHLCDNPPCVRPDHLFLGTNRTNTTDSTRKGRRAKGDRHWTRQRPADVFRGSRHPRTHLSDEDVLAIRRRLAAGETQTALAGEYGIGQVTVSEIKLRKTWSHLNGTDAVGSRDAS